MTTFSRAVRHPRAGGLYLTTSLTAALSVIACQAAELDDAFSGATYQEVGRFCVADVAGDNQVYPIANAAMPASAQTIALTFSADQAGNVTASGHQGLEGVLDRLLEVSDELGVDIPATIFLGQARTSDRAAHLLREHADQFLVAAELVPDGWGVAVESSDTFSKFPAGWSRKTGDPCGGFPCARVGNKVKYNADLGALEAIFRAQKERHVALGLITTPASWVFMRANAGLPSDPSHAWRMLTQLHATLGAGMYWHRYVAKEDVICTRASPSDQCTYTYRSWTYNSSNVIYPLDGTRDWYCDDIYDATDCESLQLGEVECKAAKDAACETRYVEHVMGDKFLHDSDNQEQPWKSMILHIDTLPAGFRCGENDPTGCDPARVNDMRSVAINALPELIRSLRAGCESLDPNETRPCYQFVLPTDPAFPAYASTLAGRIDAVEADLSAATEPAVSHTYEMLDKPPVPIPGLEHTYYNAGDAFLAVELLPEMATRLENLEMKLTHGGKDLDGAPNKWLISNLATCRENREWRCRILVPAPDTDGTATLTTFNVRLAQRPLAGTDELQEMVVIEGYLGRHRAKTDKEGTWTLTVRDLEDAAHAPPVNKWTISYVRDPIAWAKADVPYDPDKAPEKSNALAKRILCDGLDETDDKEPCYTGEEPQTHLGVCVPANAGFSRDTLESP